MRVRPKNKKNYKLEQREKQDTLYLSTVSLLYDARAEQNSRTLSTLKRHSRNIGLAFFLSGILQRSSASCADSGKKNTHTHTNESELTKPHTKRQIKQASQPFRLVVLLLEMLWRAGLLILRTISTAEGSLERERKKKALIINTPLSRAARPHPPGLTSFPTFTERCVPNVLVHITPQQHHLSK